MHDEQTIKVLHLQDGPRLNIIRTSKTTATNSTTQTEKHSGADSENSSTFLCKARGFKFTFVGFEEIISLILSVKKQNKNFLPLCRSKLDTGT